MGQANLCIGPQGRVFAQQIVEIRVLQGCRDRNQSGHLFRMAIGCKVIHTIGVAEICCCHGSTLAKGLGNFYSFYMKLNLYIFLSVLLGSLPVVANDIRLAPASQALDVLQFDFNNDGYTDRAVLIEDEAPDAKLVIYTSMRDTMDEGTVLKEPIWSGFVAGQYAQLHSKGRNNLVVTSSNQSIGRNRWTQTLTIAHRENAYRVVGFSYEFYDTLNQDNNGRCDVNYLNRTAEIRMDVSLIAMEHAFGPEPITEWSFDNVPDACFGG
jgi:hypothetical protein